MCGSIRCSFSYADVLEGLVVTLCSVTLDKGYQAAEPHVRVDTLLQAYLTLSCRLDF